MVLNECGISAGNLTQVGMKNIETLKLLIEGTVFARFFLNNDFPNETFERTKT